MATSNGKRSGDNIGTAVTEVSERVSLLIREEIELAKAEMGQKVTSITKGAVAVGAGAMFAVFVLLYALTALAWGIAEIVNGGVGDIWIGFLAVSALVLVVAIAAFIFAWRKFRVGAPTPEMAIDEARKIRETVTVKAGEND